MNTNLLILSIFTDSGAGMKASSHNHSITLICLMLYIYINALISQQIALHHNIMWQNCADVLGHYSDEIMYIHAHCKYKHVLKPSHDIRAHQTTNCTCNLLHCYAFSTTLSSPLGASSMWRQCNDHSLCRSSCFFEMSVHAVLDEIPIYTRWGQEYDAALIED